MASPWQTVDSAAVCGDCEAFEVAAMTKAPPPATVAALASSASFFFVLSVLLRDMRGS
ncbi:hypothetical protein GCM10022232_36020 [Streptomyces plumbiresistens]|uniref:Uncharacterized protein n=1 Tax=Streptomyces plumbiresistens TaxID=511811 RepID=A0ABP7RE21_9ACTN